MNMLHQTFLAASLMCSVSLTVDPSTHQKGWMIKCGDVQHQTYIQPNFVKRKGRAKEIAKEWLNAHRPDKYVISASDLLAQMRHK